MAKKEVKVINLREIIRPNETSFNKYYGVEGFGQRGFITREQFRRGNYVLRCLKSITQANGWSISDAATLEKAINQALAQNWRVYQFDTYQELGKWLLAER